MSLYKEILIYMSKIYHISLQKLQKRFLFKDFSITIAKLVRDKLLIIDLTHVTISIRTVK